MKKYDIFVFGCLLLLLLLSILSPSFVLFAIVLNAVSGIVSFIIKMVYTLIVNLYLKLKERDKRV